MNSESLTDRSPVDHVVRDNQPLDHSRLIKDIAAVLNKHSVENESNTPDFILAQHLVMCLVAFNKAVNGRSDWYGRHDEPGQDTKIV